MKRLMKGLALLLTAALLLGIVPAGQVDAAKKMKLSKKKLTLKVGQSKKLKVKNKKGKVKWTSSKKKIATVSKKGVVKAKKAGKATIKAKITYKKKKTTLTCKVTVNPKKKATPTPKPTQKPATPTPKPRVTPTPIPTPKKESTITDEEMEKASRGYFSIYRMGFENLTYQLAYNSVYVTVAENKKLNEVLSASAVSKLNVTVKFINDEEFAYSNEMVDDVRISNIQWHEGMTGEWEWDLSVNGYYSCRIYAKTKSGSVYWSNAAIGGISGDYGIAGDGINITGVEYNGKMLDGEAEYSLFFVNTGENKTIKDLIPNPSLVKLHFTYLGKEYIVKPDMEWVANSYYEDVEGREPKDGGYYFLSVSTRDGNLLIKGGRLFLVEPFPYLYVESGYDPAMDVDLWTDMGKAVVYPFLDTSGKETLQELFEDDLSQLDFVCKYKNRRYEDAVISNVVWHEEPYYANENDSGYYSFTLTVTTQDGKKVAEDFVLVEPESFVKKHMVTGKITAADDVPLANMEFRLWYGDEDEGYETVQVKTDDNGGYKVKMASGHYTVNSPDASSDIAEIDVYEDTETLDIHIENLYLLKGTLKRGNQIWPETWVTFTNDQEMYDCMSDENGKICTLLPVGTYSLLVSSYESDQSITVNRSQLDLELTFNVFEVKGTLKRTNGEIIKNRGFTLKKENEEEDAGQLFADEDGNYLEYIEPGKYSVMYDEASFQVGTITVTNQDITQDLLIPLAKITVTATRFGAVYDGLDLHCIEDTGDEMEDGFYLFASSMGNGKYELLVPFNKTVTLRTMDGSYEGTVSVQEEDKAITIALDRYQIQGQVIRTDAGNAPIKNQWLKLVQGREEIPFPVDPDGSYSVLAGAGTWQVLIADSGLKLGEITVTADNDNQNIEVAGVIRVQGTITKDGAPYDFWGVLYSYTKDGSPSSGTTTTDESGCYEVYVPAGVTLQFDLEGKFYNYTVTQGAMDQEFDISHQSE